jgi:hypothetical protein
VTSSEKDKIVRRRAEAWRVAASAGHDPVTTPGGGAAIADQLDRRPPRLAERAPGTLDA